MQFTVDCELGIAGLDGTRRLRDDGTWRSVDVRSLAIAPHDMILGNPSMGAPHTQRDQNIEFDGTAYRANSTVTFVGDPIAHVFLRVHRNAQPHQFTRDDVRTAIRHGRDDRNTALVVTLDGVVELRDRESVDMDDAIIAVRHETFMRGNGYVGTEAAADEGHVSGVYERLLYGWITHLRSGEPGEFVDCSPSATIEELERELDEIRAQIAPSGA